MHDGDEGYQPSSDEPMHLHSDDDDGGSSAIHSVIAIANEVTTVPKRPQQRDNTSKRPREEDVSDTLPPTQRHRQTLPGGRGHRACTPSTHENDAIRFDGSPTDSQALNGHISDNDTHTSTKQASGSNSGNVGQGAVPSSLASDCSSTAASKIMAQIGHVLTGWDKDVQELNAPSNAIERLAEINALSVDLQNLEEDEVIAKKALIASQYQLRKSVEAQQKRQSSRDKIKRHLGGLANDDGGVGDDRAELATTGRSWRRQGGVGDDSAETGKKDDDISEDSPEDDAASLQERSRKICKDAMAVVDEAEKDLAKSIENVSKAKPTKEKLMRATRLLHKP